MNRNPILPALLVSWLVGCGQPAVPPSQIDNSGNGPAANVDTSAWPTVETEDVAKDAHPADNAKLADLKEPSVTLRGVIIHLQPTRDGKQLNAFFAPVDSGPLVWIDRPAKERLDAQFGGDVAAAIAGREIVVRGKLEPYGGFAPQLRDRLQLALGPEDDLQLVTIDGQLPPPQPLVDLSQQRNEPRKPLPPVPLAEPAAETTPIDEPLPEGALRLIEWNTQSDQSTPATIAEQLKEFDSTQLFALSEVDPAAFATYLQAVDAIDERPFADVRGQSGDSDRLQIVYDTERLELLEHSEPTTLREIVVNDGKHRSPLIARFRDRVAERDFLLVVVHHARGDEQMRNQQARGLREWARDQAAAVVACGDFNFDYHWNAEPGNESFRELIRDNILAWVQPKKLVESNWTDEDRDGRNDYPASLIEGFLVAGPAKDWQAASRVIVRAGDFPDDDTTSDHRPVELVVAP